MCSFVQSTVSVLFNEPKLLKLHQFQPFINTSLLVSVLFNEPKLLKSKNVAQEHLSSEVSVLFNEPKLLKLMTKRRNIALLDVSVLFNEPKLLKFQPAAPKRGKRTLFQCSSTSRNC